MLGHPALRRIVAVNTLGNFGTGIVDGVALVFAYRQLRLDAATVGLAMAVGSAGFLLTATASRRITRGLGLGLTLAISCLVYAAAPFALLLGPLGYPLAAVMVWRLLYGVSLPPYDVNAATIRQAVTPDRLQGRAIAAINTIGWGALGLGPLLGGVLGERIGAQPTILIGGVRLLARRNPRARSSLTRAGAIAANRPSLTVFVTRLSVRHGQQPFRPLRTLSPTRGSERNARTTSM